VVRAGEVAIDFTAGVGVAGHDADHPVLVVAERDFQRMVFPGAVDGEGEFGTEPASVYFIEDLENGIHPTRLSLVVDLIERQAERRGIRIVATSHSPQLPQFLSEESLVNTSLIYRLPNHPDALIKPILKIPNARRVIKEQPIGVLHASSWFEDMLDLAARDRGQDARSTRETHGRSDGGCRKPASNGVPESPNIRPEVAVE
jgi:AAA domain, putative AbiEii toxin, Type IV TA system